MKIGIFGGTFNPIHQGHLAIAEEVSKALELDRVLLIPANHPPHKPGGGIVAAAHRLEMVRLAVEGRPELEACDLEIHRPGHSYTIDTLKSLEQEFPPDTEFFLIMGLDAFLEFPSWREEETIRGRCHIVVVSRPGFRYSDLLRMKFLRGMDRPALEGLDAGRQARYDFPLSPATTLILIRVTAYDVSATQIRAHVLGKKRLKNLLPPQVESYIMRHRFYSRASDAS